MVSSMEEKNNFLNNKGSDNLVTVSKLFHCNKCSGKKISSFWHESAAARGCPVTLLGQVWYYCVTIFPDSFLPLCPNNIR